MTLDKLHHGFEARENLLLEHMKKYRKGSTKHVQIQGMLDENQRIRISIRYYKDEEPESRDSSVVRKLIRDYLSRRNSIKLHLRRHMDSMAEPHKFRNYGSFQEIDVIISTLQTYLASEFDRETPEILLKNLGDNPKLVSQVKSFTLEFLDEEY
ncbi:hypothetical protein JXB02_05840 [Candidatus Woesearchaeota archaeon]|nr:hypothetical protein [Candidatus Woesearchaeota archaeon]